MKEFFSPSALAELKDFCLHRPLLGLDYDGTLSPIVPRPTDAVLPTTTSNILQQLNQLVPLAIISGRGREDLASFFSFQPAYLIGNHGLEGLPSSQALVKSCQRQCQIWQPPLQKIIAEFQVAGMYIEDKFYSLTLHFKTDLLSPQRYQSLIATLEQLHPRPRLILGKNVINLLPPEAPHKGRALQEILQILSPVTQKAIFIGDDDTDEDVFQMQDPRIMTIRVGRKSDSQAKYFLEEQSQVDLVLLHLLQNLKDSGPQN